MHEPDVNVIYELLLKFLTPASFETSDGTLLIYTDFEIFSASKREAF